jgi:hypothetical protein
MRVISQDGTCDVPYELVYISIGYNSKKQIIVYNHNDRYNPFTLAEYSTEEKAIKAMELLRACYQHSEEHKHCGEVHYGVRFVFQFPQDDEIYVGD